jgi:hypothetical protein
MAEDFADDRSRRAILLGAAGGIAAAATTSLVAPTSTRAANGDPVLLGQTNAETAPTTIENTGVPTVGLRGVGNGSPGLDGWSHNVTGPLGDPAGTGVRGVGETRGVLGESRLANASLAAGIGVHGASGSGPGLRGDSTSGPGVRGTSSTADGVEGIHGSGTAEGAGVRGHSAQGPGVLGTSASTAGVRGVGTSAGVLGESGAGGTGVTGVGADGVGVAGVTETGRGVSGVATAGFGVEGVSDSNIGVRGAAGARGHGVFGASTDGVGVAGDSAEGTALLGTSTGAGYALRTVGRLAIDRSGVATVPAGQSSISIPYALGPARPLVLATIQNAGVASLQSAVPDLSAQRIRFNLARKVGEPTVIAFAVLD